MRTLVACVLFGCAPLAGGGDPLVCGDNVCEADQTCCGCGFCASPGQRCPDSCEEDAGGDEGAPPPPCTDRGDCRAGDYCHLEACEGVGECLPQPTSCEAGTEVCGCDGRRYPSECHAARAGTSLTAGLACASTGCAEMDAVAQGMCGAFFGYAFDGTTCNALAGCACEGADCSRTFTQRSDCEAAYEHCG